MSIEHLSYGILAGGRSRRMGVDKAALKLQNQTFLNQLIQEFKDQGPLMISVRDKAQGDSTGCLYVEDTNHDIGPMEGLRNLLNWTPTEYIFICACDMPFLKYELVEYLAGFISPAYDCYAIADGERLHPLCAIYSVGLAEPAGEIVRGERHSIMRLLDQCRVRRVDICSSGLPVSYIQNINTKEDYLRCVER